MPVQAEAGAEVEYDVRVEGALVIEGAELVDIVVVVVVVIGVGVVVVVVVVVG